MGDDMPMSHLLSVGRCWRRQTTPLAGSYRSFLLQYPPYLATTLFLPSSYRTSRYLNRSLILNLPSSHLCRLPVTVNMTKMLKAFVLIVSLLCFQAANASIQRYTHGNTKFTVKDVPAFAAPAALKTAENVLSMKKTAKGAKGSRGTYLAQFVLA